MEIQHRTRRLQHLAIRAVFIALAGIGLAQPAAAAGDEPTIVRVRSTDPSLAALIDRAAMQSPTFQRLLATIQHTNGMVQIEPGVWPLRAGVPENVDGSLGVLSIPPRRHRQTEGRLRCASDGVDGARTPACC